VHHSETDLDLTTGLRFHPVEALFVQGLLLAVIAVLGLPPAAVALAGLTVIIQNFLTHANLRVPEFAERWLRLLIITPGMHRLHHSENVPRQNTNFGTIFSVWDRVFGTYHGELPTEVEPARYGLAEIGNGSKLHALGLLLLPFRPKSKS
jgi:sterol desaturase/sphingolipid hydroxylase (fatty acid hydroxylase superfamily)